MSAPHVAVCGELGFRTYRGNPDAWAYRPRPDDAERIPRRVVRLLDAYLPVVRPQPAPTEAGRPPVNVAASRYLRPYVPMLRAAEPLRERRLARELARAARERRLFHLWWHPDDFGLHLAENLAVLRRFLDRFRALREHTGMETLTMGEAADRLLEGRTERAASSRRA